MCIDFHFIVLELFALVPGNKAYTNMTQRCFTQGHNLMFSKQIIWSQVFSDLYKLASKLQTDFQIASFTLFKKQTKQKNQPTHFMVRDDSSQKT